MFSVRPGRISLDDVFDDGRAWARRDSRHMSIRKSFVRIFALALVCALCIACVGCDGSKNNSTVKPTLDDSNVKEWWVSISIKTSQGSNVFPEGIFAVTSIFLSQLMSTISTYCLNFNIK